MTRGASVALTRGASTVPRPRLTRLVSVALLALVAFAVGAAPATAGQRTLRGEIRADPSASVALTVARKQSERRVTAFSAKRFAIGCEGGVEARLAARLTAAAPLTKRGRFTVRAENDGQRLVVKGTVRGTRSAGGTFTYSGLTRFDGPDLECRSGKLSWTARRGTSSR